MSMSECTKGVFDGWSLTSANPWDSSFDGALGMLYDSFALRALLCSVVAAVYSGRGN